MLRTCTKNGGSSGYANIERSPALIFKRRWKEVKEYL